VRDEHDRLPLSAQLDEVLRALPPERSIANCKHFVVQQDVGIDMCRDRKAEPNRHAARVVLQLLVGEALELREGEHVGEPRGSLPPAQTEKDRALDCVLSRAELGIEADAELDEGRKPSLHRDGARVRNIDTAQAPKQCALATSVPPQNPERLAFGYVEADIAERGESFVLSTREWMNDAFLGRRVSIVRKVERLRYVPDSDRARRIRHRHVTGIGEDFSHWMSARFASDAYEPPFRTVHQQSRCHSARPRGGRFPCGLTAGGFYAWTDGSFWREDGAPATRGD
jgi:hypothetical protein